MRSYTSPQGECEGAGGNGRVGDFTNFKPGITNFARILRICYESEHEYYEFCAIHYEFLPKRYEPGT